MSVVDEVKARTDIIGLISRYTPLKRAGSIYKGLCPFHSERTPSFVVYPQSGTWHCFGACGTGGDVFNFLMRKENLDFREAMEALAREAGVPLEDATEQTDRNQRDNLYEINAAAGRYFHEILLHHPAAQIARDYLQRRQMDQSTIERFQLGFALDHWTALRDHLSARNFPTDSLLAAGLVKRHEERDSIYDAFRNRVMIPIRDRQGRVLGFGGRVLDDSQPKYLNTADTAIFHKSHIIYGIDVAHQAIRDADQAVIVEGYMDVIAAHQHGFSNVIACMGTALTAEQLRQLQRYTSNFVLALDADAAGQAATVRGLNQARQSLARVSKPTVLPGGRLQMTERLNANLTIISMPAGLDPDDVVRRSPDLWRKLVTDARPLVDFYFAVVSGKSDLATASGKGAAVTELAPLIAELDDEIERQHYTHQLARLVQVDEMIIDSRVRAAARTAKLPAPASDVRRGRGAAPPGSEPASAQSGLAALAPSLANAAVPDQEDHLLAILLQQPDLLVWLSQATDELDLPQLRADDLERADSRELFSGLKRYIQSDEPWDVELFQEGLSAPLHPKLAQLMAYGAQLPPRSETDLREGILKALVHLRLARLKHESIAVRYLVDEAQHNGEAEAGRELGSIYGRIQRELSRLQPLKLRENHSAAQRHNRRSGTTIR